MSKNILKNRLKLSLLALAILFMTLCYQINTISQVPDPFINSVSMNKSVMVKPYLSLEGGNILYIRGGNFDDIEPNNNIITFGKYNCQPINQGVQPNMITCRIQKPYDPTLLWNIPITIKKAGANTVTDSTQNRTIFFGQTYTPFIEQIFPKNLVGSQKLSYLGIHKIQFTGDGRSFGVGQIQKFLINDVVCSMIDVQNQQVIDGQNRAAISCNSFQNQEVGQYEVSQYGYSGKARNSQRIKTLSLFTNSSYDVRILPYISKMSSNRGSAHGNIINLEGRGFSSDKTQYQCEIAGQICKIIYADQNQVTIQAPIYDSSANFGQLSSGNYAKGNGFEYIRYSGSINLNSQDQINSVRNRSYTGAILEEKIATQLSTPEIYEQIAYTQFLRGYFYAPVNGTYIFSTTADDKIMVKFSNTSNSQDISNLNTLLYQPYVSSSKFTPFNNPKNNDILIQASVSLTQGQYYYMEVISVNTGGIGFFKVMVDTPQLISSNNETTNPNPTWQMSKINITQQNAIPQIIQWDISAYTTFKIRNDDTNPLSPTIYDPIIRQTALFYTANVTASQIQNQLNNLPSYKIYSPQVALNNGILRISFFNYRLTKPPLGDNIKVNHNGILQSFTKIQNHNGPLSGNYTLTINSIPLIIDSSANIPYNTPQWKLQGALKSKFPNQQIKIKKLLNKNFQDEISFILEFVGMRSSANVVVGITSLVQINSVASLPTADYSTTLRDFDGLRSLFNPVLYDFLKIASNKPSLHLKVKGIAAYSSVNSYQIDQAFAVAINTGSTLIGTALTFSLNDTSINLSNIDFVMLAGSICQNLIKSGNGFTCSFDKLNAGMNQKLFVQIVGKGFADNTNANQFNITLGNPTMTPNSGNFAGTIGQISGNGFPFNYQYPDDIKSLYVQQNPLQIIICGVSVTNILTVENTKVTFQFPQFGPTVDCINGQKKIKFAGIEASFSYSYDPASLPTITSFSPIDASPITKGTMYIEGTNFDIKQKVKGFLRHYINDTYFDNQYQLTIVSSNSTNIQAIMGGGRTGNYLLVVVVQGKGIAKNSQIFTYGTFIDTIQPTSGPLYGGNKLTINGRNFLNTEVGSSSLNVFIGVKKMCIIKQQTTIKIVCEIPQYIQQANQTISQSYTQNVTVTSRITEESICTGNCQFTYVKDSTFEISMNQNLTNNATFNALFQITPTTISSIDPNNFNLTLMLDQSSINFTVQNGKIAFNYPSKSYGSYPLRLIFKNSTSQFSSNTITLKTNANIAYHILPGTVSYGASQHGSTKGQVIIMIGSGLPLKIDDPRLVISQQCNGMLSEALNILSTNTMSLQFQLPPHPHGTKCTISSYYKYDPNKNKLVPASFTYTYNSSFDLNKTVIFDPLTDLVSIPTGQTSLKGLYLVVLDSNLRQTSSIYRMVKNNSIYYPENNAVLPSRTFGVKYSTLHGYATVNNIVKSSLSSYFSSNQSSSYVGGKQISISGGNFIDSAHHIQNNQILICGTKAKVLNVMNQQLTFLIPQFVTKVIQDEFEILKNSKLQGIPFADSPNFSNPNYAFDNSLSTFYSSNNTSCQIGMSFGSTFQIQLSEVKFMPSTLWTDIVGVRMKGAKFVGKIGGSWVDIFQVDVSNVHSGWNFKSIAPDSIFDQVKFVHDSSTGAYSNCQLSQLQFYGKLYSTENGTCDVTINGQLQTGKVIYQNQSTPIITKVVNSQFNSLSFGKPYGKSSGSEQITITGQKLQPGNIIVKIDGNECTVTSNSSTQIKCLTSKRSQIPSNGNSFVVTINGNLAYLKGTKPFRYVDRFSDSDTWQGQTPPRSGDSLHVPKGQTLLVDANAIRLYAVIIEGNIIFENGNIQSSPLLFEANYFVLNDGSQFQIGTEDDPYLRNLTLTMYGDYYDKQLPTFGNKGIGCKNCKFSMYGRPINDTWSELSKTANKGDIQIQIIHNVNDTTSDGKYGGWRIGDQIVIASTSLYHNQSQVRRIQKIQSNLAGGCIITLNQTLKNQHISVTQTYAGGRQIVMRAEVGLLTRNILMQGDPDYEKSGLKHGSHLLLTGKEKQGLIGHIAYSQFRFCGQPKIVARYCTHFHMAGQVPSSYVKGNSVHNSHARVLTIHGSHYLTVEKNVGYLVQGHNFFVEDGIQTNNIIQDNLAISSLQSFTMTQSDVTVASFWITNPYNIVRRNHAGGGDFYGFWYQIMQNPTGPSATPDICPMGMQIQQSRDNVAHSYFRFGLRIFELSARKYPCQKTRNISSATPYDDNTPILNVFDNYTLWRNQQSGFLGQKLGYTTIQNFKVADNVKGGLQFHKTNFTHPIQFPVIAKDSLIIGLSSNMYSNIYNPSHNPLNQSQYSIKNMELHNAYNGMDPQQGLISHLHRKGTRGLFTPRTNGFKGDGLHFQNFYHQMTPLQSNSQCWNVKLWVVGSKTSTFNNVSYFNIKGNYIFWQNWRRQIYIDLDGSLLNNVPIKNTSGSNISLIYPLQITPFRANVLNPNTIANNQITLDTSSQSQCFYTNISTNSNFDLFQNKWNDSVICHSRKSGTLRGILFANTEPVIDFKGIDIRVIQLRNINQVVNQTTNLTQNTIYTDLSHFGIANQIVIKPRSNDIPGAFAMPFRTGKIYNIHWKQGIDFTRISIAPSPYWSKDQRVLLRFNYSDVRQQYLVNRFLANATQGNIVQSSNCMGLGVKIPQTPGVKDIPTTIQDQTVPYIPYSCNFSSSITEPPPCKNGQYINDRINRVFIICVSGDSEDTTFGTDYDKPVDQWITVVAKRCHTNISLSNCNTSSLNKLKTPYVWSEKSIWPNLLIPGIITSTNDTTGINATIKGDLHVVINVDYIKLNALIIDGALQFGNLNSEQVFKKFNLTMPDTIINRDITLQANYIWVRGINSQFIIGRKDQPFTNKAEIILNGQKSDRYMLMDQTAAGNKMLGVTGSLTFYGLKPTVTWSKLSKIAIANQNVIQLIDNVANVNLPWKINDQIIIAPTYSMKNYHQKMIIKSIDSTGKKITLQSNLMYQHYGAANITANRSNSLNSLPLDARGAVGLLSRNIKIRRGQDANNWGCRVLVAQTWELVTSVDVNGNIVPSMKLARGRVRLQGVQLDGCGQKDSTMAGLRLQNLGKTQNTYRVDGETSDRVLIYNNKYQGDQQEKYRNTLVGSSIHSCNGYCFYIDDYSRDIHVDNNVFYHGQRQIVYAGTVKQYNFTNNLMIYAYKRTQLSADLSTYHLTEDVACYQQFKEVVDIDNDNIRVQRNLAQGSEGQGFVFPYIDCLDLDKYPFVNNTAGSCQIAFMLEKLYLQPTPQCIGAKSMIGYASQIGLQANPPGNWIKLIYDDVFFADNQRGITLRYAHQIDNNTCWLRNSQFLGFSRPNEPDIYNWGKNFYCYGGYALRGFTTTISGQTFPLKKEAMIHDVICTQQSFDFKAFLTNVTFQNYLWTSNSSKGPSFCKQMSVLKRHIGASDGTAPHYLRDSPCINCEQQAYMNIDLPSQKWFGWFGGCGQMNCTGPDNVILHDTDGKFFGSNIPSQVYGRGYYQHGNTDRPQCKKMNFTQTFICYDQQLVLLQYENKGDDAQKRMIWPIQMYDYENWRGVDSLGSNGSPVDYYSLTNAWKQWQWDGPQPMNKRIARFWSVVRHNRYYNLTYASQPPAYSIYQLNRRDPLNNPIPGNFEYVVLIIYFPLPNSIQIYINDTIRNPQILVNQTSKNLVTGVDDNGTKLVRKCGANNFFFKNGTIQFVVNSIESCQVKVKLSSFIQINVRIDVPFFSFYKTNLQTSFISNIAAFLNIDPGRFKILGLRQGSIIVDFIINFTPTNIESQQIQQSQKLKALTATIVQALLNQKINVGGVVLSASGIYGVVKQDGTLYVGSQESSTLTIILATVVPGSVLLIAIILLVYCYLKRRRAKISHDQSLEQIGSIDEISGKPSNDLKIMQEQSLGKQ